MAQYRNVQMNFWTDPKVEDSFTPEDRYFFLYAMTNPRTNLCGCYEVSKRQMGKSLGYDASAVTNLLYRMENVHHVMKYNEETNELLIINWGRYNWTASGKVLDGAYTEAKRIKNAEFKSYVMQKLKENGCNRVEDSDLRIPYGYPMDTLSIPYPESVSFSLNNNINTISSQESSDLENNYINKTISHPCAREESHNDLVMDVVDPVSSGNEVFITLPLNTKEEYPITFAYIDELRQLYPAVDIEQEFRKMKGWCNSNPKKRKTKSGILNFITNWLSKEQDSGGRFNRQYPQKPQARAEPDKWERAAQAVLERRGMYDGATGVEDSADDFGGVPQLPFSV